MSNDHNTVSQQVDNLVLAHGTDENKIPYISRLFLNGLLKPSYSRFPLGNNRAC